MKDRRRSIRWQINTKARLRLEGTVEDIDCDILDLSFSGVKISLVQRLPENRPLKINITLPEEFSLETEVWVVWHKRAIERNIYGIYFSKIKERDKENIYKFMYQNFPEVLKASGGKIPQAISGGEEEMAQNGFKTEQDRRIFERIPVSLPVKLIDLDAGRELEANTCDLSAKGVGMVNEEYLIPGHRLELWLEITDKKEPFYTKGKVIWAISQEVGKYRVGVSLERAELMGISGIFRA